MEEVSSDSDERSRSSRGTQGGAVPGTGGT